MLNIYTSKLKPKKLVKDIEQMFNTLRISGEKFNEKIYTDIMKSIDNVQYRDDDIIETAFGKTLIDNLSTGCKAAILSVFYNKTDTIVSIDECGTNAIMVLFRLASKIDLSVYTENVLKLDDKNIQCTIDGKTISDGYNIYKTLERIYE